jgi:hypothetical protein
MFAVALTVMPDAIDKALLETPLYVALKDKDPQSYALIRDRFAEGIRRGSTSLAMLSEVRSVFQGQVLPKYLKAAPDVALVNYWNVQVEEIRYMRVTNPQVCLQYLFPAAQSAPVDLGKFLGADLLARDLAALTVMIQETGSATPRSATNATEADLSALMARVVATDPKIAAVFIKPADYYAQPAVLCGAFVTLFENVGTLPPAKAAPIIRSIFAKS